MLSPLICGANFEDDQDLPCTASSSPSPRRCGGRRHAKNNPYSDRGLDKFSALLSDLTEKRRQIYSTMSSQDPPLVRFVFPGTSEDCVPVVIKLRDPKLAKTGDHHHHHHNRHLRHNDSTASAAAATEAVVSSADQNNHKMPLTEVDKELADLGGGVVTGTESICEGKRLISILGGQSWRRPAVYVPVALILILLFLAVFGRSVAILCTSIGWYLIPTLSSKRPVAKKEYARKLSGGARNSDGITSTANWSASTGTSPRSRNGKNKEFGRRLSEVVKDGAASPPSPPTPSAGKSRTPPCLSREMKHRKSF
ncbi:hypothetical protein LINPERPRIM_LOCUS15416 [Linum perenne]